MYELWSSRDHDLRTFANETGAGAAAMVKDAVPTNYRAVQLEGEMNVVVQSSEESQPGESGRMEPKVAVDVRPRVK